MKQILQNLSNGDTYLADVPVPQPNSVSLLVATSRTLVSVGTERMLVDFGKGNLLSKASQQPDKVRQVLEKIRTDGLLPTIAAVRNKLDTPLPLGYCNVGVVCEAGQYTGDFRQGDRVVSNGKHAEFVCVPKNLCAKVPDAVDDDSAAFTVVAAIALQGIRLLRPTLGETVAVTGLGLIGLIAVQLLRAHGCRVIGIDLDSTKLELARQFGAETVDVSAGQDPIAVARHYSRGRGVDAVLITASTKSNAPIQQGANMCRKRGRIVLVGVVGMEMSRADFYEKELSFQVSCSYGPGRYDPDYEEKGQDYPLGFVRWTEQRNFEAVLDMLADGRLNFRPLISHRFPIEQATDAYALLDKGSPLGILLEFPASNASAEPGRFIKNPAAKITSGQGKRPNLGFIGAGNYASAVLIPAFAQTASVLRSVACASGVSGINVARKFSIQATTTDTNELIADPNIDTLVISTRHDSHARWVCAGLAAGKHIFVEKPLALTRAELASIQEARSSYPEPILMVGFNRRYAPQVTKIKAFLAKNSGPKSFVVTVNAGAIPQEHWTQDPQVGGGRIIGEACHFIDLIRHLANAAIVGVSAVSMGSREPRDTVTITLTFTDGSIGTIHYFANGTKAFPKERIEVFSEGAVLQLDNFRTLRGFNAPGLSSGRLWKQDKGQIGCVSTFVQAITSGDHTSIIPFNELEEVMRACFDAVEQLNA